LLDILSAVGVALINIDDAPIKLNGIKLENCFDTMSGSVNCLKKRNHGYFVLALPGKFPLLFAENPRVDRFDRKPGGADEAPGDRDVRPDRHADGGLREGAARGHHRNREGNRLLDQKHSCGNFQLGSKNNRLRCNGIFLFEHGRRVHRAKGEAENEEAQALGRRGRLRDAVRL
jgi:hypothetical protein